jgi:hypothetical protein
MKDKWQRLVLAKILQYKSHGNEKVKEYLQGKNLAI